MEKSNWTVNKKFRSSLQYKNELSVKFNNNKKGPSESFSKTVSKRTGKNAHIFVNSYTSMRLIWYPVKCEWKTSCLQWWHNNNRWSKWGNGKWKDLNGKGNAVNQLLYSVTLMIEILFHYLITVGNLYG